MTQPMTKHDVLARVRLARIHTVLVIGAIGAYVLYRMHKPSISRVCDHMGQLAPNSVVQPKIDRAFDEVPQAAKQTAPGARCEAYFTALRDDPHGGDEYSERSGCVLDAKSLSSVAACLEK